jgi:hypothetical protein
MVNGVVDGAVVEVDRRESESRVMPGTHLLLPVSLKKNTECSTAIHNHS